jgi:hypothetical protein
MPGTFTVLLDGSLTNSLHITETFGSTSNKLLPQTGQGVHSTIHEFVTCPSSELITFGDVNPVGYIYMKNLDSGTHVNFGSNNGGSIQRFARLDASGEAWFRGHGTLTNMWLEVPDPATGVKVLVKAFEA